MPAAESAIVLLPRFTTLAGESLVTEPLDVSQFASAQFQVWCGARISDAVAEDSVALTVFLEESLDCQAWTLGAGAPKGTPIRWTKRKLFSYAFRLRWFRLRIEPTYGIVTCWAEGILR